MLPPSSSPLSSFLLPLHSEETLLPTLEMLLKGEEKGEEEKEEANYAHSLRWADSRGSEQWPLKSLPVPLLLQFSGFSIARIDLFKHACSLACVRAAYSSGEEGESQEEEEESGPKSDELLIK